MPYAWIIGSILVVSLTSLIGVCVLALHTAALKKIMLYLVSFSTGALLGNVFLHLLPEMVHMTGEEGFLLVLVGLLLSFIIEKFIHWRHCHSLECDGHVHPVGPLVIIGDAAHNIIDGILIATAYLVSIPLGVATTTAVFLHEVPQEFGDFAVLIHSGMSKSKALLFNFFSALTAFIGAALVIVLTDAVEGIEHILVPLAAGNFLYIAGSDLIPELHKESRASKALLQLVCMVAGIGLMMMLASGEVPH